MNTERVQVGILQMYVLLLCVQIFLLLVGDFGLDVFPGSIDHTIP